MRASAGLTHTITAPWQPWRSVAAAPMSHPELLTWTLQHFAERTWLLQDCGHLRHDLERDLLAAGQSFVRVTPNLMAGHGRERIE